MFSATYRFADLLTFSDKQYPPAGNNLELLIVLQNILGAISDDEQTTEKTKR